MQMTHHKRWQVTKRQSMCAICCNYMQSWQWRLSGGRNLFTRPELFEEIRELMSRDWQVNLEHVYSYRGDNCCSNQMAKISRRHKQNIAGHGHLLPSQWSSFYMMLKSSFSFHMMLKRARVVYSPQDKMTSFGLFPHL